MSRENAAEWLEPLLQGVAPELAREIRALLASLPPVPEPSDIPSTLAAAALHAFDEIAGGPPDRQAALRLLAADATLTYAFEAAVTLGTDVSELAERVGPRGELGRRLERAVEGS